MDLELSRSQNWVQVATKQVNFWLKLYNWGSHCRYILQCLSNTKKLSLSLIISSTSWTKSKGRKKNNIYLNKWFVCYTFFNKMARWLRVQMRPNPNSSHMDLASFLSQTVLQTVKLKWGIWPKPSMFCSFIIPKQSLWFLMKSHLVYVNDNFHFLS